jgi:hypothetical protein
LEGSGGQEFHGDFSGDLMVISCWFNVSWCEIVCYKLQMDYAELCTCKILWYLWSQLRCQDIAAFKSEEVLPLHCWGSTESIRKRHLLWFFVGICGLVWLDDLIRSQSRRVQDPFGRTSWPCRVPRLPASRGPPPTRFSSMSDIS